MLFLQSWNAELTQYLSARTTTAKPPASDSPLKKSIVAEPHQVLQMSNATSCCLELQHVFLLICVV